ncbi:F-BOX PROTEIN INTERACTION DOMAIN PROTEIN-RELATED [Salix purpurea]|uniref:F-BOX PROTEIN INTERACTION DOMAIN PROTEIN-RELATED n=1 Tax=Salix purpurea TaxID=77065 RepID=A0A9Q0V100_SALPP|nr:F-BOX PROTEIN INTERACTION DOMAIN PROTEIN-RELATED [Salix purpurea]
MMADLEDCQMEEIDDDPILPDEVDPFEGSLRLNMILSYSSKSSSYKSSESCAKFPGHIKQEEIKIEDVVRQHALCFLPAKSVCRFKTVSKEWLKWIDSPFFAHKQTNHFKHVSGLFCQFPGESPSFVSFNPVACGVSSPTLRFLPEPVDVRTSCNGLLGCQSRLGDNAYYICNPVTEEWRMVPKPTLYHGSGTAIALAFEPDALQFEAQYELICAVTLQDRAALLFEIYSSRTNSWRVCTALCLEQDALPLNGDGFYIRGFVYWETQSGAVLGFDLKEEEYGILSLPPTSNPTGALTELRGELCYLLPRKDDDEWFIEVYGNMDMSLRRVIPLHSEVLGHLVDGQCRALAFVNDDTMIIATETDVIAYQVRAHTMEWVIDARTDGFVKYLPYVNSLASVGPFRA